MQELVLAIIIALSLITGGAISAVVLIVWSTRQPVQLCPHCGRLPSGERPRPELSELGKRD